MKLKLILSVLVCGLAVSSVECWLWAGVPNEGASPQPNDPPLVGGTAPGRFTVHLAERRAVRLDTATGKSWTLEVTRFEVKDAAGNPEEIFIENWKECLEPEAMKRVLANPPKSPVQK